MLLKERNNCKGKEQVGWNLVIMGGENSKAHGWGEHAML